MADEIEKANDAEETEEIEEEVDETEDGEEVMTVQQEFGALLRGAQEEQRRLKRLAMGAQQAGDNGSATLLREVAGSVIGLQIELISACGAWFEELADSAGGIDGSHLEEEDAEKLYALLGAFKQMVKAARDNALAGTEQRDGLEKLDQLIDDQRAFILDISDYEPPEGDEPPAPPEEQAPRALGDA